MDIIGFIAQLSDGSVEIFAKGEKVNKFVEELKKKEDIYVEELLYFDELKSNFKDLEIKELKKEIKRELSKRSVIKRPIFRISYFKKNWGAPFIIAFMLLLISAAVYLSVGLVERANQVAIYAYYSLVLGVILQIVSYIKYKE